jgi:hypothetical protein
MKYADTFIRKRLTESNEYDDNTDLVDDEQDDFPLDDELDEISVAAGAGAYETPYAFGNVSDDNIEMLGYKRVKTVKKESNESDFLKMSKAFHLNEISYKIYKKDNTLTPAQKINYSIHNINKGLREIENVMNRNVRLRQEMGIDTSVYWKPSREKLSKISERLIRVSKQLRELAS